MIKINIMEKLYKGKLRCITCAGEDFEFNEDKSHMKCTKCGHEYLGGYNELLQCHQDAQDKARSRLKKDIEDMVKSELRKVVKEAKKIG